MVYGGFLTFAGDALQFSRMRSEPFSRVAMLIPSPLVALLQLSAGRRNGSLRIGHAAFSQCKPDPDLPPWMMYHVPMDRVPWMKLARWRAKLQCASIGGGFNINVIAFERFLAMQSRGHRSATWYTPKPFLTQNYVASEIRLAPAPQLRERSSPNFSHGTKLPTAVRQFGQKRSFCPQGEQP